MGVKPRILPNLLRKSSVITQYPLLNAKLASWGGDGPVPDELAVILDQLSDAVIQAARGEWAVRTDRFQDLRGPVGHCELCGNGGLRYVYSIRNTQTGAEYSCGSDCVQEYGLGVSGYIDTEAGHQVLRRMQAVAEKSNRSAEWARTNVLWREKVDALYNSLQSIQSQEAQACRDTLAALVVHWTQHGALTDAQMAKYAMCQAYAETHQS